MKREDLRRKWVTSPAVERFESGRCSKEEFAAAFTEEWGLSLEPEDFIARFRTWVGAPYPGTGDLLAKLRNRHMLACLSNTNTVHWEKLLQMDGLRLVLERPFVSHELGAMKPSPAVCPCRRGARLRAGDIAFFDDGPENIAGAAKAGLSAHLTAGPHHLRRVLGDLGLL